MSKTGEAYIQSPEKRAFDVIGAGLLAIGAAPLAGAAALGLCIQQRRPNPLFRQERIGRNSNPFIVNKLRTLSEQGASDLFETFGPTDPRATIFAKFVRKVGLDEWPQFTNILTGDMSLVGVRPQVPIVLEQRQSVDPWLFQDWYYCYEKNPGLFGAGQAYTHDVGYYLENGEVIRTVMKLDIQAFETASLGNDINAVFTQPFTLIRSALRSSPLAT
ncbi:MAG TPA: sugar transferase [Candidatus Saccharibacteria bacterium]|nr:sugar transferase [Candidatus Saccharibacteria bacterium]